MHTGKKTLINNLNKRIKGKLIILLILITMTAVLISCKTVQEKNTPSQMEAWISDQNSNDLIYTLLNLRFPEKINDFNRGKTTIYDKEGLDTGIGYNHNSFPFWVTIFIYLKSYYSPSDIEGHFEECKKSMRLLNKDLVIVNSEKINFNLGDLKSSGYKAFAQYRNDKGECGSYLVVMPYGERFVTVRATFIDVPKEVFEKAKDLFWYQITELMGSINFPSP